MNIDAALRGLQATSVATGIRDSLVLFPLLEATHVLGLSLMVGTIVVIDLRLLGVASQERSFQRVSSDLMTWAWGAFALTACAGALMFTTNADVYFHNVYFRMKVALLALAAVNVIVFRLTAYRTLPRWDRAPSAPASGRAVAVVSLVIWVAVIFAGRMIGFTTTRAAAPEPAPSDINFEELLGLPPSPAPDTTAPAPKK
jgi:hypothetical protein